MDINEAYAAVCAAPDDDAPRIAYANFIEEYDAEHAVFIRAQLARFNADRAARATHTMLDPKEFEILRRRWQEWSTMFRMFRVPSEELGRGLAFERGFVAHLRMHIENVVGLGERWYQWAPIQHLDVAPAADPGDDSDPVRVFEKAKGLDRLETVSFANLNLGERGAKALAQCHALKRASWMDLRGNNFGRTGLVALLLSPIMANKVSVLIDYDELPVQVIEETCGRKLPYFNADVNRYAACWLNSPRV